MEEDWSYFRSQAEKNFDISPSFFDLVITVSARQRYLQVVSYFAITEEMGIKVYPGGEIEGVYEAVAGAKSSYFRGDREGLDYFYSRLKTKEQRSYVSTLLQKRENMEERARRVALGLDRWQASLNSSILPKLLSLAYPPALDLVSKEHKKVTSDAILLAVIESGDVALITLLLANFFILPTNFNLEDVPRSLFWQAKPKINKTLRLRSEEQSYLPILMLNSCLRSGCIQLADLLFASFPRQLYESYLTQTVEELHFCFDPEGLYTIFFRYGSYVNRLLRTPMPEVNLLLTDGEDYLIPGNIVYIESLLEEQEFVRLYANSYINVKLYPLTSYIQQTI